MGSYFRLWQLLYRSTPNFRGKGKALFDWPSRFICHWPNDIAVRSRTGCAFLHCDLNVFLYRCLFVFGLHELDVDWMCQRLLQDGDVFVDVGACFGYHALTAARCVGTQGKVYAIEPQPDVFEVLQENVRCNGLANVEAGNFALSDRNEILRLHRFSDLDFGHTSMAQLNHRVAQVLSCTAITFDDYVVQKAISRIALVKLDVEGAELKVLEGASELLRSANPPMWVIEVNMETAAAFGYQPRDIFFFLAKFGYQVYRPVWGSVTRNVYRVQFCPPEEIQHGQNLLCAIPERHRASLSRVGVR